MLLSAAFQRTAEDPSDPMGGIECVIRILKDDLHRPYHVLVPCAGRKMGQVHVCEFRGSVFRFQQPDKDPGQGRLSGSAFPDQSDDFAAPNGEAHLIQGL